MNSVISKIDKQLDTSYRKMQEIKGLSISPTDMLLKVYMYNDLINELVSILSIVRYHIKEMEIDNDPAQERPKAAF